MNLDKDLKKIREYLGYDVVLDGELIYVPAEKLLSFLQTAFHLVLLGLWAMTTILFLTLWQMLGGSYRERDTSGSETRRGQRDCKQIPERYYQRRRTAQYRLCCLGYRTV